MPNRAQKRAAQRLKLAKYARWIPVPGYDGERIQLKPCTAHDLMELREIQADAENLNFWPVINALIADWTFADDDGEKLPLTAEGVRAAVPFDILRAVMAAAMDAITGREKLPFAQIPSPAPSTRNHATDA